MRAISTVAELLVIKYILMCLIMKVIADLMTVILLLSLSKL